jgi:pyruvate dehydrogenase E2 component (dihydrolipoamide acetyltransferase)
MSIPVIVAKATISMEEGLILKWFKAEGDRIAQDEVLFEMETDKAIVEVVAPVEGLLLKILVAEGPVKVESIVGWIGQPGERIEDIPDAQPQVVKPAEVLLEVPESKPAPSRIVASPAARRRAMELGIALEGVQSATPGGRIAQEDVERAFTIQAAETKTSPGLASRRVLIEKLTATWQSVPHIHIARHLDVSGFIDAKKMLAVAGISMTDLILWVLARTLPLFPELSMVWQKNQIVAATNINLAFAVDTNRGVVAPVISSANALGLEELSRRRRELMEATEARRIGPGDLQGGVFTLTNLGMQGVDFFIPVINAPQTSILATGKMGQVPVVSGGAITIGWRMWVNLAVDHRVADGMAAARFLEQLQVEVAKLPETLAEHS